MQILPLAHQSDFLNASEQDLLDFAAVLRRTMIRLDAVLGGVQYNYFLHSAPHDVGRPDYMPAYHWHLEICPRTAIPTGFELGSGLFINTMSPEEAAQRLREVPIAQTA